MKFYSGAPFGPFLFVWSVSRGFTEDLPLECGLGRKSLQKGKSKALYRDRGSTSDYPPIDRQVPREPSLVGGELHFRATVWA